MKTIVTSETPARRAGEVLTELLSARASRPTLLMLSGGSAFSLLSFVSDEVLGEHLTISVLDERFSVDPSINNFAQLMAGDFYLRAQAAGATFFDSRVQEGEALDNLAFRFNTFLHDWCTQNPEGLIIATLGMGTDGHTAGMFPGSVNALTARGRWVESYILPEAMNPHCERVTVTPLFLTSKISHAVAYVVGPDKHALLATVTNATDLDPEKIPAALWQRIELIFVVTDK